MSFLIAHSAGSILLAASGTLVLFVSQCSAQCQGGSQQQSGTSGTQSTSRALRQGRGVAFQLQRAGVQNTFQRAQQSALQQQLALQQQVALQNLLGQQQLAALGQQQQPPQQSTLGLVRQRTQQQQLQRVGLTQPPTAQAPLSVGSDPQSEDPETTASRQLNIARALVVDSEKAGQAGDSELATQLRIRAAERLQRLTTKYSGTQAADEAQKLMRRIE